MPSDDPDPVELEEPSSANGEAQSIWMRAVFMILFAIFFGVAETLLCVMAVVQFFWMLFTKERNSGIANFGAQLGHWLAQVSEFQTAATEEKPFPWGKWG